MMYPLTTPASGGPNSLPSSVKWRALGGAALIAAALVTAPALADTKAGVDAWEAGDFDGAVAQWRTAAATGDADAAFNLGQAYKVGRGVPQDLDQALIWYKQAMDAGHVRSSDYYGLLLYQMGRRSESIPYIRQSAGRGEPRAQYVLGAELFNGTLIEKDWVRAYAMMTRASSQGLEPANRVLAEMDGHIPLAERQQGIALAEQIELEEASNRVVQMGSWDLRPIDQANEPASAIASASPLAPRAASMIEAVDLPPSRANAPVAASPPATDSAPPPAREIAEAPRAPAPATPVSAPVSNADKPKRADGLPAGYVPSVALSTASAPKPKSAAPTTARAKPAPAAASASASGDWRVQMGAFSAMESAQRVWREYEGKVSGLDAYQPYLVKAGSLVKLQYGPFASRSDAEASCRSVERSGGACFTLRKD